MTFEKAITIFIVAIIIFILVFWKSSGFHRIGYIALFLWYLPHEAGFLGNRLFPFLETHPFWNTFYSPVLLIILLIYGIIGIPEAIIRIFSPFFTFHEMIMIEYSARKMAKDPSYAIKKYGEDPLGRDKNPLVIPEKEKKQKRNKKGKKQKSDELKNLMDDLNGMIGLFGVKKEISDIIELENFQKEREKQGLKRNGVGGAGHLVFAGNPGTGKTTVARKLAAIYKELGVVSIGQLIEVDRSKLVGQYVGETAQIVQRVIQSAIGGVLFIDEAYALLHGEHDTFGQEAIDTLLKEMEDHRNDLIVIVAGYPDEMSRFLNSNPGLSSRFKKTILFEDYNPEELLEIYKSSCRRDDNILSPEAEKIVLKKFTELYKNRGKNFGNGRTARGLYAESIQQLSNRVAKIQNPTKDDLQTILPNDVVNL